MRFDRPLAFRADLGVRAAPGEGAVLFWGGEHAVVAGELAAQLVVLVDGRRSAEEIAAALAPAFGAVAVYTRLLELAEHGWLTDAAGDDVGPAPRVGVAGVGVDAAVLDAAGAALAEAGAAPDGMHAADLVLAHDYADPMLAGWNARALDAGRPWLLARVSERELWIGPWMIPRVTACWACVRYALATAGAARRAMRAVGVAVRAPRPSGTRATTAVGVRFAALHVCAGLARGTEAPAAGTLLVFEPETLAATRHTVRRRPQCPACGDAGLYGRRAGAAFALVPDGAARDADPAAWLARHAGLVDPVAGLAPSLEVLGAAAGGAPVRAFASGPNVFRAPHTLREARAGLRTQNGGKGRTDAHARAGALAEAVERASAAVQGDEPVERASAVTLGARGERALDPNACMLFSPAQYAAREAWNAGGDVTTRVPLPFDPARVIDWSPVWSLTRGGRAWLPTGALYYGHDAPPEERVAIPSSNGVAAGASREDAFLQALLELVERDAVALWWYNRVRRPGIPLDSAGAFARSAHAWWRAQGRELWALDLTHDLGIPVAAALACGGPESAAPGGDVLFGFGAHVSPELALERAILEVGQIEAGWRDAGARARAEAVAPASTLDRWLAHATLASDPYLAPAREGRTGDVAWSARRAVVPHGAPPYEGAAAVQAILDAAGLEVLALDLTRADLEVPVVRAIVPGLRHFWARFALGRLYDVPVRLGWLRDPTTEDALNPVPFFL